MAKVILYMKDICPLCDEVRDLLLTLQHEYAFELEERDIYTNDEWLEAYHLNLPVVEINHEQIDYSSIDYVSLEQFLQKHL